MEALLVFIYAAVAVAAIVTLDEGRFRLAQAQSLVESMAYTRQVFEDKIRLIQDTLGILEKDFEFVRLYPVILMFICILIMVSMYYIDNRNWYYFLMITFFLINIGFSIGMINFVEMHLHSLKEVFKP